MFKSHKKTWIAGLELLLIIVTVLVATYAWLTDNKEVKANDVTLRADAHYNLLLSLDSGETWITETALNLPGDFEFKHEITGNGINMYIPSNKRDDGTPVSFTTANGTSDYLEFSLMFKLAANASIFLDASSYVSPAVGTLSTDLLGSDVERISIDGDFSRDLIASSVRIAFIENELIDGEYVMNSEASLVWAPNKNYEISCTGTCTANINSTNPQDYKYIEAANNPVTIEDVINVKDEICASAANQSACGDPVITTTDINENAGVRKVLVRIWIEGNDRDNVTALTGGLFKMNLQFSAINKGLDNVAPVVLVGTGNTIDGYVEGMEYSSDYGLNWTTYNENNNPTFETGDIVYVRKSENMQYFASSKTILEY